MRKPVRVAKMTFSGTIICVYPSIESATAACGIHDTSSRAIRDCVAGKRDSAYGYRWREYYTRHEVDQYDATNGDHVATYASIAEASRVTGIAYKNIWRCCKGATVENKSSGFIWKLREGYPEKAPEGRPVVGVSIADGHRVAYPSEKAASRAVVGNVHGASSIKRAASGRYRSHNAYGYTWEYKEVE